MDQSANLNDSKEYHSKQHSINNTIRTNSTKKGDKSHKVQNEQVIARHGIGFESGDMDNELKKYIDLLDGPSRLRTLELVD